MHRPTLRRIGTLTFVIVCSFVVPSLFSSLESSITPHFDPVAFGLPVTANEVPSKRTEKAITFEITPGKFASVSTGNELKHPSCDKAKLSSLCRAVFLVRGIIPYALATSEGPNSPGTVTDDASYGSDSWTTPSNASASDNVYASASENSGPLNSHYLNTTGYNFNIPASGTIDGIIVEIERKCSSQAVNSYCKDSVIKLIKNGTVQGNNNADTVTQWSLTEAYFSYGGSSDLWGVTLTTSDINASNFGAVLGCTLRGPQPG